MGDLYDIGMVGLGVMGKNLVLNIEDKGFSAAAYDAWPGPVDALAKEAADKRVGCFKDLKEFVGAIARPRRIVMLVKAGDVVDSTIEALTPLLHPGDLLIDGGNEYFENTETRAQRLALQELRYVGMGISGGARGARLGPSLMPGGSPEAYDELAPVLTKIAAQHADGPCVAHIGPGGAGHYVKMVHNGIEYGDMQLIAEAYDLLKHVGGMGNQELSDTFGAWNEGELESYLIEITSKIFATKDPDADGELVDHILDATGMKGTGKWTVQEAAELAAPVPTIAGAVDARVLSAMRPLRQTAAKILEGPEPRAELDGADRKQFAQDVRHALYATKCISYAQGMHLIGLASDARGWGVSRAELARIWQDGCIIRARLLSSIKQAYARAPELPNLLFDDDFRAALSERQGACRRVLASAFAHGVPALSMASSLAYYDSLRRSRLPANLTQAQRDFFGAHTFQRTDKDGSFHHAWEEA